MTQPPSTPVPSCPSCGGEGFRFEVRAGKAAAVACECTRACPSCHGTGRIYALDPGGLALLRTYVEAFWQGALMRYAQAADSDLPPP